MYFLIMDAAAGAGSQAVYSGREGHRSAFCANDDL